MTTSEMLQLEVNERTLEYRLKYKEHVERMEEERLPVKTPKLQMHRLKELAKTT